MDPYINEKLKALLDAFDKEEREREKAEARATGSRVAHSIRVTRTTIRYRAGRKKWK